jgi:UDP-N-acetylmuramoyl-tripeptide--D-alanyl-D-alanine ligase
MIVSQIIDMLLPSQTVYTSPKNFNGEFGLPLSILNIQSYQPTVSNTLYTLLIAIYRAFFTRPKYDIIVLEYGIDHPQEMQKMLDIVKPDIAIWTGLDYVHVSQFESINHIAQEKSKLVLSAKKLAYICIDHPLCREYVKQIPVDILTFSSHNLASDLQVEISDISYHNDHFVSDAKIVLPQYHYHLRSNLILSHDIVYGGVWITIADTITHRLQSETIPSQVDITIQSQWGRFQILKGISQSVLIDSTYNATPQTMYSIIQQTVTIAKTYFPWHRLIIVLGQMNELGDQAQQAHTDLAHIIDDRINHVILYGYDMQTSLQSALLWQWYPCAQLYTPQTHSEIIGHIHHFIDMSSQPCMILFKGSQSGNYLEECIKPFLANPADKQYLVRQDTRRLHKKGLIS